MGIQVYASVHYHDSAKAVEWLEEKLGFRVLYVVYGPEGPHGKSVQHAELQLGQSAIFLGQKAPNTLTAFGLYVGVDEKELLELHESLQQRGVEFAKALFTTPYDTKEMDVKDLEDNIWTFGTYRPGARAVNGPGCERRSVGAGLNKLGGSS